jgi:CRISPR/Cas system endoribonuclease Cas6 (RAMP superfamily)
MMLQNNEIRVISQSRMTRGLLLLEQGIKIVENENGNFSISSRTKNAVKYLIKGLLMKRDLQIINHREKKWEYFQS